MLGFQSGHSRFSVTADRVILALPFSILRNLDYGAAAFNDLRLRAIQQLGYGTNAKLHLQFDNRFWNQPGPWGISNGSSYSDRGYQSTWDVTRAQPGATGILVDYTGGSTGASFTGDTLNSSWQKWDNSGSGPSGTYFRSNSLIKIGARRTRPRIFPLLPRAAKPSVVQSYALQFLSQAQAVFPGIAGEWNGRATLDTPARSPYMLGSYSYWKTGQYTSFAGAERERSGKCHFAGEHCSINFQGYMEGGAQEGLLREPYIIDGVAENELLFGLLKSEWIP